jgi:hypothetical protein
MRQLGDSARRHRQHRVIEMFQRKAVQIGEIAWDMDMGNLTLATAEILIPRKEAIDQHHRIAQFLAAPDDGPFGRIFDDIAHCAAYCRFFFRADFIAQA